jgi:hypothetical protein
MTDVEMIDTSKKEAEEGKKVEKEPDDQFYGKRNVALTFVDRTQEVTCVDGKGSVGTRL